MDDLRLLETFPALKLHDPKEVRDLWPKGGMEHPARMRFELARQLVRWAIEKAGGRLVPAPQGIWGFRIADPMMGVGTIGLATLAAGADFYGAEIDEAYYRLARAALSRVHLGSQTRGAFLVHQMDAAEFAPGGRPIDALITSPMFPKTHSQGSSAKQTKMRKQKQSHAGNAVATMARWRGQVRWVAELRRVLAPWIEALTPGRLALIHVKNHIERGRLVRVDEWAAFALSEASLLFVPRLEVLGYIRVPLDRRSWFRTLQHMKNPAAPEVLEERVVVFRRRP